MKSILVLGVALAFLTCCHANSTMQTPTPFSKRILFIGNSFTSYNGGIEQQVQGLAPESHAQEIAVGGYTLQDHWNDGQALQAIRQGKWDYVVLQEQSQRPIFDRNHFFEYTQKFDSEIRKHGAKTVLWMTWERPESAGQGVTTANLAVVYNDVGKRLGVTVAPAGSAFARALREKPDLTLYQSDGHPTVYGTYLAACVLYATIFNSSPVGNSFSDWSITGDQRAFFQQIAAETVGR